MLIRIGMLVIIARSELDAFVVKVLYLDKFWRNSSPVGLVKVNDFFENNLKATIKK